MAIWLNQQDVASVLTMEAAITAVEHAFRELALGNVMMPQRVGFAGDGGGGAAMPATISGAGGGMGVKVVTLFSDNTARGLPVVNGTLLLLQPDTGQLLAVMDAGYMTAVRTGAVGGVAIKHLARRDANTVTIFGAGVQARTQLAAAAVVRPLRHVQVVDTMTASAARFVAEMRDSLNIEVEVAGDVQTAVETADILITATTAHEPIFDGAWLRPGVHINAIGAHAPRWRELDGTAVRRAKIVTDQTAACLAEAGDLIIPIAEGMVDESDIHAELGQIITGQRPGRQHDEEITLFKSVGLALQDVAAAALAYQRAMDAGVGQELT